MELNKKLTLLVIFTLLFFNNINSFCQNYWTANQNDSLVYNCYCQGSKDVCYQSKIIIKPVIFQEMKYIKLYICTSNTNETLSYNLIRYNNDTIYIKGGGNDTIKSNNANSEEILMTFSTTDSIRTIHPYTKFGTLITFIKKEYCIELDDTLFFYLSSFRKNMSFGSIIYNIVIGKKSGIVYYTYYDNNINHFCLTNKFNKTLNIKVIKRFLKVFNNSDIILMFNNRDKFPKGYYDSKGKKVYI